MVMQGQSQDIDLAIKISFRVDLGPVMHVGFPLDLPSV